MISIALCFVGSAAHALEPTWLYAVQVSATVNASPPRIELSWTQDWSVVTSYTVHRKSVDATTWGEAQSLAGNATGFVDENVELGKIYEYQISRHTTEHAAYGYIAAGINAPLADARGRVILVVDRSIADPLAAELNRFQENLSGDGWFVVRKDVARDATPAAVKTEIKSEWDAHRATTKAVLLVGRVPIVKSGNLNVDGHGARPLPADVFYGDMDGIWTDENNDGVFDQSTLPSDVELQVGRIDFSNLPTTVPELLGFTFPSEVELLRRYLEKNHAYRHAITRPTARALIGDRIGLGNGQAYAATGYRSFTPLVGATNISSVETGDGTPAGEKWLGMLARHDFLWVYGNGAGANFAVNSLGSNGEYGSVWASDFINHKLKGSFYLMFGSWFVDWSQPGNLLRAALTAPDYGLAAAWAGRPHLFFHHMALGETIGQSMRVSQNNAGAYQNEVQRQLRGVHIALMGDATLRQFPIAPPSSAAARVQGNDVELAWTASRDTVLGYHVYRAPASNGPFTRLTGTPVTDTRFVDTQRIPGSAVYLVRAVTLQSGPSGSYYDASQGAFARIETAPAPEPDPVDSNAIRASDVVWFDDALPAESLALASDNDRWNWVPANPVPFTGTLAHQSETAAGLHQHFFAFANPPLAVEAGDTVYAYVYLDPQSPPRQAMVTWLTDTWEHRAYWGENIIGDGVDGTGSRRYIGPLPPTGRWVRLEIPASAVNLEGRTAVGMGYTLFDGRATWDRTGKSRP